MRERQNLTTRLADINNKIRSCEHRENSLQVTTIYRYGSANRTNNIYT